MLTRATAAMPTSAWPLSIRLIAPLPLLLEVGPLPEEGFPVPPLAGAVGVKVAPGSDTQELAAELAAEMDVGARGLTVPFPAKLQAWGSRLFIS